MKQIYPLQEHVTPLTYPFNAYGQNAIGALVMEMSEDGIRNELEKMRTSNRFKTVWSVKNIDQRYMDQPVPFPVKSITWQGFMTITLPASQDLLEPLTWFDLWRVTDGLLQAIWALCGPDDHRFIVGFESLGGGDFEVALDS